MTKLNREVLSVWLERYRQIINSIGKKCDWLKIMSVSCPYCRIYYRDYCQRCPVFQYTGLICCAKTPYSAFLKHICNAETITYKTQRLCKAEIDFLKEVVLAVEMSTFLEL